MGIKSLFGGAPKTAAETLKAVEAKIADLENQDAKLMEEKRSVETSLAERLRRDATGEAEFSEEDHKRVYANLQDVELRRQRNGATIDALKAQLPTLKADVLNQESADALARIVPVNEEIRKQAAALAAAVAKVRQITAKLGEQYQAASELKREFEGIRQRAGESNPHLPASHFPYPHPANFEVWQDLINQHMDEHDTDWMSDSAERDEQRRQAEIEKERQRQTANEEAARKQREAEARPVRYEIPRLNSGESMSIR